MKRAKVQMAILAAIALAFAISALGGLLQWWQSISRPRRILYALAAAVFIAIIVIRLMQE